MFPPTGVQRPWHLLTVTSASTSSHVLGPAKFFKAAETDLMATEEMLSSYAYYKWISFSQETQYKSPLFYFLELFFFLSLNYFSYLAFLQSSLKCRDKQKCSSSRAMWNDITFGLFFLYITLWHLAIAALLHAVMSFSDRVALVCKQHSLAFAMGRKLWCSVSVPHSNKYIRCMYFGIFSCYMEHKHNH